MKIAMLYKLKEEFNYKLDDSRINGLITLLDTIIESNTVIKLDLTH